ncbi:hypothetical protein [Natronocalculus amylovorans]|uniref:Uncharacterized protein n=1 Tax=Natronocalculus amylovorans TaxID=2917812 RepID=A0AAE3G051_9EURY|nr:hypothetical protein [Natronocalculus amylovorans]MCL9818557.1 hypothetical protein [Natronocalculus amylovorans]
MGSSIDVSSITSLQWIGISAAAVSAVVHLVLGLGFIPHWMGFAFMVAVIGFGVGIVNVLRGSYLCETYLVGIPFVLGQIAMWIIFTRQEFLTDPLAIATIGLPEAIDKVAQVILLVVLVVLLRQQN